MPSMAAPPRPYRGLSPEARVAQRRRRLIEAGLEVFGSTGVSGATVKQLCGAAGLTERYFYESFANQPALFGAVYDHGVQRVRTAIVLALAEAPPQAAALAEAAMTAFFEILRDEPALARVLLVEVYGCSYDLERLYQRGVLDFAQIAKELIDTHDLLAHNPMLDPELMSTAIVGATIHLALRWHLGGYVASVQTMVAHGMALLSAVQVQVGG